MAVYVPSIVHENGTVIGKEFVFLNVRKRNLDYFFGVVSRPRMHVPGHMDGIYARDGPSAIVPTRVCVETKKNRRFLEGNSHFLL